MNKRSYLDTLNAGRQRRPHTTLEQLNRSLETLEQRLEQSREEATGRTFREASASADPRYPRVDPYRQQRPVEAPRAQREPAYAARPPREAASSFEQSYQSLARDIERLRGQEDGVAMVGRIAGELRGLREELRHQMTADLHREFETLRRDIDRASRSAPSARDSAALGMEFERLSGAIQELAEKSDDKGVKLLRLELEQVRSALDSLAREESVRAVDRRWDDFDRRWSAFETRFGENAGHHGDDRALAVLTQRLEQIGEAVNNLPESLSLRSLEEKVRTLAGAVDHFANQGGHAGDTFALIDERLDEISRAIVASTVAAQASALDPASFERIEQRMDDLARQIEEVAQDRPAERMLDHLDLLSRRVDELAGRADLPEQAIERLGRQIELIADRIDRAPALPDTDRLMQELEQRFDVLSGMIERRQGDALEQSHLLFRDLEQRLDEVADRLDRRPPASTFDSIGIMEAIDARFSALAQSLDMRASDPAAEAALRGLESRLDDISHRLDTSAAQVAGIDPDLIRSLEAQVAGLSEHLSRPGAPLPEFEDIAPRIERIEQSLAGNRDSILEAAQQAAESAVRSLGPASADAPAVAGLAQDLKTLEALTRRSDERNARTFEAIHDTLLKIVDRLGSLEGTTQAPAAGPEARPVKISVADAPTIALDEPLPLTPAPGHGRSAAVARAQRTPAEAAAAAAAAALGAETVAGEEKPAGRKSFLGGLARSLGRKAASQPQPEQAEPALDVPAVDLDQPLEPKFINRPLEPGSGAPDLNAIMKRVRDERGPSARQGEGDASKADFIAAARRAAQAAAAEAEMLKKQSTVSGPVKALRFGDLLKARRKPILMAAAAIMLALAGLQLGKAFMADPQRSAANDATPVVEQAADVSAVTAPAEKAEAVAPAAPVRLAEESRPAEAMPAEPMPVETGSAEFLPAAAAVQAADAAAAATSAEAPHEAAQADIDPVEHTASVAAAGATPLAADAATADAGVESAVPAALRDAAAAGDANAMFEIGSRFAEGRGVKEDMEAAAQWYEKAAGQGLAPAEYRIGNFYEKGIGVARDLDKAKNWYRLAAEQGNASAMHNLAVLFAMAADGTANNQSAAHWFQKAAELGVKDSQFNLGILAAKGAGMPQDLVESYKWFALVAKAGDKDAADKRDEVAKALRPEQLERARAVTELWKAKPLDRVANDVNVPAAWQDAPTTIASADMKRAVQNIQHILNKNGYTAGGADGLMGDKTRKAIMAFQADNGLDATGEVDDRLVKALLARK
ncbi:peptidoglycan-binding protein [Mesorhizobium sp. PUT5]|uniref:peptidoglycan-binding protein n=1 Tax=Mesorhizobium sp. PUT5 TaxID=3454629 RepID=UPI003FA4887A